MSDDIETWTDSELLSEIESRLNPGEQFWCGEENLSWVARLLDTTKEGSPVVWQELDFTQRGVLFRAFYRVWIPPQDSAWVVNPNRPSLQAVAQKISEKYSDPEDLDPAEVAAVYTSKK